jgi:hypothetical protein
MFPFPILGLTNKNGQPMIIGFAGKATSGKDTAGTYFIDNYQFLHYYFAKPLKEGAKIMFGLTDEQVLNKEKIIEPWGKSPRQIYQLLGTEVGRGIDTNVWVKNAQMFIKNACGRSVVITDVRFSNEALWIREQGGVVVYIERDQPTIEEFGHSSENGLVDDDIDIYIDNDGTIEDLHNKLGELVHERFAEERG